MTILSRARNLITASSALLLWVYWSQGQLSSLGHRLAGSLYREFTVLPDPIRIDIVGLGAHQPLLLGFITLLALPLT